MNTPTKTFDVETGGMKLATHVRSPIPGRSIDPPAVPAPRRAGQGATVTRYPPQSADTDRLPNAGMCRYTWFGVWTDRQHWRRAVTERDPTGRTNVLRQEPSRLSDGRASASSGPGGQSRLPRFDVSDGADSLNPVFVSKLWLTISTCQTRPGAERRRQDGRRGRRCAALSCTGRARAGDCS